MLYSNSAFGRLSRPSCLSVESSQRKIIKTLERSSWNSNFKLSLWIPARKPVEVLKAQTPNMLVCQDDLLRWPWIPRSTGSRFDLLQGRICERMSHGESKNIVYICRYPLDICIRSWFCVGILPNEKNPDFKPKFWQFRLVSWKQSEIVVKMYIYENKF